jgi:hypothetical protein
VSVNLSPGAKRLKCHAADQAVELLNRGFSPKNIWDGIFTGAVEFLMRKPGIVALHSVTTANALHYAWQHTADDQTCRNPSRQSWPRR